MEELILPHNAPSAKQHWRALRVENFAPDTSATQLLNLVNTGMIESLAFDATGATLALMNYASTVHVYVQWQLNRPRLAGRQLTYRWQSMSPVPPKLVARVAAGASRNVYFPQLPTHETQTTLHARCAAYGEIESVRIKGTVAFVHFLSVASAVACVDALSKEWPEISFGHDRCAHITKHQKQLIGLYLNQTKLTMDHATLTNTLAQMATAAMAVAASNGGAANVGNRTVVLLGLSPRTTVEQVCLVAARGGLVQNVKLISAGALVTFVEPIAAAQFFATWNVCELEIGDAKVRVDYAKYTPHALDRALAHMDDRTTRNIYIGNLPPNFDRAQFAQQMCEAGALMPIHWVPESNCAFTTFADMEDAGRAWKLLRSSDAYKHLPTRFAKDRMCGPSKKSSANMGPFMLQYLAAQ